MTYRVCKMHVKDYLSLFLKRLYFHHKACPVFYSSSYRSDFDPILWQLSILNDHVYHSRINYLMYGNLLILHCYKSVLALSPKFPQ